MSFSSPYMLVFLLFVPVVAVFAVWIDRRRAKYAVAFTNLDVLASVASPRRRPLRWVPLVLFLVALAAASTALARPRASVSEPAQRATLVLLVDVSGSMRASDVKPSRLGAAQEAMTLFAAKVPKQVKVGLVSFSTSPNVLVIPTTDRGVLRQGIDLLAPEAARRSATGSASPSVAQAAVGSTRRGSSGKVRPQSSCSPAVRRPGACYPRNRVRSVPGPPGFASIRSRSGPTTGRCPSRGSAASATAAAATSRCGPIPRCWR
jgi:Ca-activated chloride channel family protein